MLFRIMPRDFYVIQLDTAKRTVFISIILSFIECRYLLRIFGAIKAHQNTHQKSYAFLCITGSHDIYLVEVKSKWVKSKLSAKAQIRVIIRQKRKERRNIALNNVSVFHSQYIIVKDTKNVWEGII